MPLSVGIKDPFNVTVQGPHNTDPGQHRRAVVLCNEDQSLHGGLPFGRGVIGSKALLRVERFDNGVRRRGTKTVHIVRAGDRLRLRGPNARAAGRSCPNAREAGEAIVIDS
jgi:hypothetical protein